MNTYQTWGKKSDSGQQSDLFGDIIDEITLRPEQREAIDRAKKLFCDYDKKSKTYTPKKTTEKFLWNAKMRFGKTVCALQLAREMNVKRTLIVTHRPVVNKNWKGDFELVFGDKINGNTNKLEHYKYGTLVDDNQEQGKDETCDKGRLKVLEKFVETTGNHYVFFVSMQYLRLSPLVNEKSDAKHHNAANLFGEDSFSENDLLKEKILTTDWDLVVIDEAHEGTRTALGMNVINKFLIKKRTKILHLSGTPFNLYEDFDKENEIFTWDYIQEQDAKANWDGEGSNPYEELPRLHLLTYSLGKLFKQFVEDGAAFKFSEFFRTWTGNPKTDKAAMPKGCAGRFVHENEVRQFLDKLCEDSENTNFPFSTDNFRDSFNHTLWVVPGVKEAAALKQLLEEHDVFGSFGKDNIINVAGDTPDDEENEKALERVINAIGEQPEKTYTITITCSRLTTGVTVKPWTAVLYMKGSEMTSAATYMQTIFRVQSPCTWKDFPSLGENTIKKECFVFDFAPIRQLKMVAETAKFSSITRTNGSTKNGEYDDLTQEMRDKQTVRDFMDRCPMGSLDGGTMEPLDVNDIYKQLDNALIDRLVRKGFDDNCLYNQDELNRLDPNILNHIGLNGGLAPGDKRKDASETVVLSHMTEEERKEWEENIKKKRAEAEKKLAEKIKKDEKFLREWESMTDEQREEWLRKEQEKIALKEKRKQERDEFDKRVKNIRGIALRIPLLMYGGADADGQSDDMTVENFTNSIKDESWTEFMPKGITKDDFNNIKRCFNATRFEEAGKRYRSITREADFLHIDDRIRKIAEIFGYFHNPDKETVLTPWRVVNMHLSDTIGGYCFFNERFDGCNQKEIKDEKGNVTDIVDTAEPRYVDRGEVTKNIFDDIDPKNGVRSKVLEINSKTGLYPLYVVYSLYRSLLKVYDENELLDNPIDNLSVSEENAMWDDIVSNNMYVICNTTMAARITKRTLLGFRKKEDGNEIKTNIKDDKLIEKAIADKDSLAKAINTIGYWNNTKDKTMIKFNAVVGNPPYQETKSTDNCTSNSAFASAIYPAFIDLSCDLQPQCVSLITPSRWMTKQGQGISDAWVEKMIKSNMFISIDDFPNATDCFPNVEIKGGVNYFLISPSYSGKCSFTTHQRGLDINSIDYLDPLGSGIVIRDYNAMSIINKVESVDGKYYNEGSFSRLVSPKHYFDRNEILGSNWKGYVKIADNEHTIKYYLNKALESSGYGWIKKSDIPKGLDAIELHKVYLPMAGGTGNDSQILGVPFYGEPLSVCSYTYLVIGYDKVNHNYSKNECLNIISYIKTRFFRYMVSIKKKTQNTTRDLFQFVPLQDFSKPWTDEELYDKYGLDMFERQYIESLIKPME